MISRFKIPPKGKSTNNKRKLLMENRENFKDPYFIWKCINFGESYQFLK